MAAAMNGLDAIVWTGGVGEHAPVIRAAASNGLGFLGLQIDRHKNEAAAGDLELSAQTATARTLVIHAREDLEIVRHVHDVLG